MLDCKLINRISIIKKENFEYGITLFDLKINIITCVINFKHSAEYKLVLKMIQNVYLK